MSLVIQNLRYAVRVLLRSPGFTLVALLTLALAIGANAAIFSVVNALLLRPLPFPDSHELVQVMRGYRDNESISIAIPKFLYVREHNDVFDAVATYDTLGSGFNLTGGGDPERVVGSRVSKEFFSVFNVRPEIGRDFVAEEDRPNAQKVVVLSHALWKRRFGGDRSLVNRTIHLNGESYVVVGIMPAAFRYPATAELWTPLGIDPASTEKANYLEITGRLKDGLSVEKAQAALNVVARQYRERRLGDMSDEETFRVKTLQERLYGELRPALLVLLGTVGGVLLIACVNIANLQLARSAARRREVAIRTALGASSSRIFAQLITESLVLSLAGGAVGLLLGYWILKPLVALSPVGQAGLMAAQASLPEIGIDGTVLAFTLGISLLAGMIFGLAPAVQAARPNLNDPLKEDSARSTGGPRGMIARTALVVAEVAVALVVIIGAALLVKSFNGLLETDPGFRPENVLTLKLSLPEARYGTPVNMELFSRQVTKRLNALPGVKKAAVASSLPLEMGPDLTFTIEGRYAGGDSEEGVGSAQYRASTPGYFEALGIPLSRGRLLTANDTVNSEGVAIINEEAARQYWPNEDPIGQRITIGMPYAPELADKAPRRIVGIVKDVREVGLDEAAPAIVYLPIGQVNERLMGMFVRLLPLSVVIQGEGTLAGIPQAARKEIWAADPQQPITDIRTMEEIVDRSLGSYRFNMLLMGALAFVALVLAAVGIYGVLSYLVNQRTREIGIRMALGATGMHVLRMVARQGMTAVSVGVIAGLLGAFAATRALSSLLVGVSTTDPFTFVAAPLVLATVALLASCIPARKASLLDPVLALRK
ncbi:MAG TPA: ABC transporter permease [Thermoanaerobaculia bacterium]